MTLPRLCFIGWAGHVHLERWAGYFARAGYEVSVISMSGPGKYPPGVKQYLIGMRGRGPRWVELKLRYLLWRIRPDIVHAHWAHFAIPVRRVWKGRLFVTAWGSDVYLRERTPMADWAELAEVLRSAEIVTCDSEDLATTMVSGLSLPRALIHVIQWGVDTDLFKPQGGDLRRALGLEGREVLLSVRNFTPLYNLDIVVEAFARLRATRPSVFLLMKRYGGSEEYAAKIRREIESRQLSEHCRIIETIPYEQMPDLYRTADVTVSIPSSDATPMSLLEAMASGSIPVVSDLPSLREWVEQGKTGFLVSPRDPEAVTAGLISAFSRSGVHSELRMTGRALILAKGSQAVHMGEMAGLYGGGAQTSTLPRVIRQRG